MNVMNKSYGELTFGPKMSRHGVPRSEWSGCKDHTRRIVESRSRAVIGYFKEGPRRFESSAEASRELGIPYRTVLTCSYKNQFSASPTHRCRGIIFVFESMNTKSAQQNSRNRKKIEDLIDNLRKQRRKIDERIQSLLKEIMDMENVEL